VVAPATFNTVNKLATGISDILALGLLNEAIGAGQPVIAVPFANRDLARHPVFTASIATLRSWGVRLVFDPGRYPLPVPNQEESGSALFPWAALAEELRAVAARFQADSSRAASDPDPSRAARWAACRAPAPPHAPRTLASKDLRLPPSPCARRPPTLRS
jgi:hypothetical protein